MLNQIFTWWSGITVGASFDIKRRSGHVGTDEYGNRYFEDRKASIEGRHRRYVMYKGLAEPSKVPADWHGWLHHTVNEPPTHMPLERRDWETDHTPNMTGTPYATKPKGSMSGGGTRQKSDSDYEAWTPDA
ncbi:MAG: NADH dehydrogenase [Hyphomonas sp. BRH_c22]|jgi:NADH:ubiquinone oxidoreductase subunit|uniref:NADH:ubiquinone oxidoreductase subunit NDUFA12 n=1 Tax=Hyphomonas sp. BRH_c22 TaxID=1629710 RepID=UPI0005F18599|nr:NADH:ubiquinone oxidoreductase subunit NDUFA12 [Hyphomonas sp. BRH_c22]KJS39338.1 MAG: NADH dehydrogenase [Hyphomonas sp. BRH_c22]